MGVFDSVSPNRADQFRLLMNGQKDNALSVLKATVQGMFDSIWGNPDLTPQQAFDIYGTDAKLLFEYVGKTALFIKEFEPSYVTPSAPKQYTINQDGTVTIIEPTPEPSPEQVESENGNG